MKDEELVKQVKWIVDNPSICMYDKAYWLSRVCSYYTEATVIGDGGANGLEDDYRDKLIPWLRRQVRGQSPTANKQDANVLVCDCMHKPGQGPHSGTTWKFYP